MDKPDVDFIEGLSPAISIDQKSASRNPRSTVGTVTEVYDYLRLLYARIGVPHDPETGERLIRQTPQQIVDRILEMEPGTRFQVLAPVVRGRKGTYDTLLADLAGQGYARAIVDGELLELADMAGATGLSGGADGLELARYEMHNISVVVDRLVLRDGVERRLTDSVETALRLAGGIAEIDIVARPRPDDDDDRGRAVEEPRRIVFSQHLARPSDGKSFEELAPRNFSFNSPYGACTHCDGLGTVSRGRPPSGRPRSRCHRRRRRHHAVGRQPVALLPAPAAGRVRGVRHPPRRALALPQPPPAGHAAVRQGSQGRGAGPLPEPLRAPPGVPGPLRGDRRAPDAPPRRVRERIRPATT